MLPPDLPGLSLVTSHGPATLFNGQTAVAVGTCEYLDEKTAGAQADAAERKLQGQKFINLLGSLAKFGAALGTIH